MDELNESEEIKPIDGQMCYDELEPIVEQETEKQEIVTPGQIGFDEIELLGKEIPKRDFKSDEKKQNLNSKRGTNLENISNEERNEEILEEAQTEAQPKQESVLDEIEADREASKPSVRKERMKQVKLDLSEADGSGIILTSLENVLHNSMIPYTEHVVLDRALPRVEDGLKPVQRRILYTMLELGLQPDKQYRKSARIVGDCMGKYHPHGDSSVYDAMVRMAQSYSLREPLVDGHGNFGSIDGDSAAAMRYTEARLTPLAMELLRDLDKNTVRWMLNFDDTLKEPTMLPGRFPNLLVNGTYGIAVGVATNIPPHNLSEVVEGIIAYIDNPKITLEEMMKIIKGPDFPTGGIVIAGDELEQAYRTGRGKVLIRAKTHIEEKGDKKSIVITEVPYQVNKATLLQKIAELREQNKNILSGITEIRDESDRSGLRAVIRLKKEANEQFILDYLFKQTQLQVTFGINMVAIAGGKPKQMGLMEIISYYTEYQREIIYRRTKFELDQAKDRAHILEGLLIAIKNIDEVIKIIKSSASVSEAKLKLRSKFSLSEKQAQAILDMRLARLVNLEVNKLKEELEALKIRIAELTKIYESKKLQLGVVKSELGDIKRRFKSTRKSNIDKKIIVEEAKARIKIEPVITETEVVLGVTASGNVKSIPVKNFNLAQKELGESSTIEHVHTQLLKTKNTSRILILTNKGNCYKTTAGFLPEIKWKEKGATLKSVDKRIPSDEKAIKIFEFPEKHDGKELVFFTSDGMVKRTKLEEYDISKAFFQAIKLKNCEEVVGVELFKEGGSIVCVTKQAMVLNFEKSDIPSQGRVSGGVKGINLDEADCVVYATQVDKAGNLTLISDKGVAKRVPIAEFGLSARYRKGLRGINLGLKGSLIYAEFDYDNPSVALQSEKLSLLNSVPVLSRLSDGKQISKDKLSGVWKYCI